MIRKLGTFEKAMLVANQYAPFNIVSVLKLENAPSPDTVKEALQSLQQRHPFLRAKIEENGVGPVFEPLTSAEVPLRFIERSAPDDWKKAAVQEMEHGFSDASRPLFRAVYIHNHNDAELVLSIHHGVADAVSGMNLLVEFLQLCSGQAKNFDRLSLIPRLEDQFPPSKTGWQRITATGKYFFSQMQEMSGYMWHTRNTRKPPMRFGGSSQIMTAVLPMELVEPLMLAGRRRRVTLNSILNAAQLLAVNRVLYQAQPAAMRTFAFADMRRFTQPPTDPEHLGNYISMLNYTINVSGEKKFWALVQSLHKKIYESLKNGDKFGSILMSEMLLKTITGLKVMRFGASALNYNAHVPLDTHYGDIVVKGLHGFVSGYDLGPELASQARLFDNNLWWDFVYLDSDMNRDTAEKILDEIIQILQQAVRISV